MTKFSYLLILIIFNYFQTIHGCVEYQVWQRNIQSEQDFSENQETLTIQYTLDHPEPNTTQGPNPFLTKLSSSCILYQIHWQSDLDNLEQDFASVMNIVTNSSFANSDTVYFDQRIIIGTLSEEGLIETKLSELAATFFNVSIEEKILDYDTSLDLEYFMSANMIFRVNLKTSGRIGLLCYFCQADEKIQWASLRHEDPQSFEVQLSQLLLQLPPSPMIVNSFNHDEIDKMTASACRSDKYIDGKFACLASRIELVMVAQKLNATIIEGPDGAIFPVSPGLHVCPTCEGGPLHGFNPVMNAKYFLRGDSRLRLLYCYYELPSETAKWEYFVRPYDIFIWSGLLITLMAYSAVYQNPLVGLALFGFLLNQGVEAKFIKKLSVAMLLFLVVTNAFLSVVTTDLVKPLRPKLYETYGEMYNNTNFRFLIQNRMNVQMLTTFLSKVFPQYKNMLQMNTLDSFKAIHLSSKPFVAYHTLAREKGISISATAAMASLSPFQERKGEYRFTNVTCAFVVQESLYNSFFTIMRLHQSKEALYYLHLLRQSGIDRYRERMGTRLGIGQKFFNLAKQRNITRQDLFSFQNPNPLRLDSMLEIVFLVYLISLGVAITVGFVELRQLVNKLGTMVLKKITRAGRCLKYNFRKLYLIQVLVSNFNDDKAFQVKCY